MISKDVTFRDPSCSNEKKVLLLSCWDEVQLHLIWGVLSQNDIEYEIDAKGLGAVTGEKGELFSEYRVYINERDLDRAKYLLDDSITTTEEKHEEAFLQNEPLKKHRPILKIVPLLISLFFGMLSFYTLTTSERFMAIVSGGMAMFFLAVFLFSFDIKQKRSQ